MAATATPQQRDFIRTLMRELELPRDRVTVMHRDLFARAGIPWRDGVELAAEINTISPDQAHALITQLKARAE